VQLNISADARLCAANQSTLRKAVLTCLEGLDLADGGTCQRGDVQVAVAKLGQLIGGKDLTKMFSSRQWHAIAELVLHLLQDDQRPLGLNYAQEATWHSELEIDPATKQDCKKRKAHQNHTIVGVGVEWDKSMDQQLLGLIAEGIQFQEMEDQLQRSARWLQNRHRQLLKDPSSPCPTGNRDSAASVKVGHRALARRALLNLPQRQGTVTEICEEILLLDVPQVQHLNRVLSTGPTRTQGREMWRGRVADELSGGPEFQLIGKLGREGIWRFVPK
jgi:hypothetical protein